MDDFFKAVGISVVALVLLMAVAATCNADPGDGLRDCSFIDRMNDEPWCR